MDYTRQKNKTLGVTESIVVFLVRASAYYFAELIYRGYSHITMFFAGGICFFLIYICEKHIASVHILLRAVVYAVMITVVEFVFGVVFNIILGMKVWDYSEEPFNVLGQVCPGFVLMWFMLSFPAILVCNKLKTAFKNVWKRNRDNALDK